MRIVLIIGIPALIAWCALLAYMVRRNATPIINNMGQLPNVSREELRQRLLNKRALERAAQEALDELRTAA